MRKLKLQYEHSPKYELVLWTRDPDGKPLKQKSIMTNSSGKLWEFWIKHQGKPKRRRKTKSKNVPTAKQAQQLLQEAAEYAEKKQQERENCQH